MPDPTPPPARGELPVVALTPGGAPPARAPRSDAAENRRKILDAAAALVAEQGPDALTMNAVARASGTGVGTVYRRFGDVGQLFSALLDDREARFQEAFLTGPPPLGPGAPPGERLRAYLHALADRFIDQRELLLAGETAAPLARYSHGSHLGRHAHMAMLLRQLRPEADAALLAQLLLAPFTPSLVAHLTRERGYTAGQLKSALDTLLAGVLAGP
ncbi:TetR/AcrR family transcriptional regulator [Streptomyces sp. NPDC048172]|uniref:TetR/AcrR family transcriptional regulator n=1 Tax=Streptomyces sp. NPDC048172 TaxID=3365505 RepID=UPI00371C80F6